MAHVRKSIRDNVVTTLTGLATTGSNIYRTRVYPLAEDKLPGLAIYTRDESTGYETMGIPRTQVRNLTVAVEIYVKGTSNYDDTLDTICVEIEEALYTDLTRGGYAKDTNITNMDAEFSGEGDQPVARATLTLDITYATKENDVETAV
jgi:hypothetical protein